MKNTPQRDVWNGRPVQLEHLWTLSKRGKVAPCLLLTHQLGWELRVESALELWADRRSDRRTKSNNVTFDASDPGDRRGCFPSG
jgi:hypothetical protein